MAGGLLYVATEVSQVAAIDPATGKTVWSYDPESWKDGRPANVGFQHRGVSYWTDGKEGRIFIATHDRRLIALDAKTGAPVASFGNGGAVDLFAQRRHRPLRSQDQQAPHHAQLAARDRARHRGGGLDRPRRPHPQDGAARASCAASTRAPAS